MRNIRKKLANLKALYSQAGHSLILLLGIVFLASFTEVIGIAMLLPILEYSNIGSQTSELTVFVFDSLRAVNLEINLGNLLILMVLIFLLKGAIVFTRLYAGEKIISGLILRHQEQLIGAYSSASYLYYTKLRSGTLNNLIFSEVERFGRSISKMVSVAAAIIAVAMHLAAAATLRVDVTISIVIAGLIMVRFLRVLVTKTRSTSIDMSHIYADAQSALIQSMHSFLYLRASGSMRMMRDHIVSLLRRYIRLKNHMAIMSSMLQSAVEPMAIVLLAALIYIQTVVEGRPIGEIVVLALLCYRAFTRIMGVQQEIQRYNESVGGVITVTTEGGKLAQNREAADGSRTVALDKEIVFDNVSFSYDGKIPALSGINLRIPANSTLGIVGESGGGKSTLILLLAGVITPTAGSISADGVDFGVIDKQDLREKIGFVTQDPVIFNGTVAENITLFASNSDDAEIRHRINEAARRAHCLDFILKLPNQFSALLGERGVNLSGGQKQRIAIARELFRNPRLMILDEATSALDSESEQIIRESIEQMQGERTIAIIAHRLSTIRHCDYIIVLAKGEIVEQGTYDALIGNKNSRFHALVEAQRL
ncbi:ABC transporter ATP-binding protein [Ferrovibrio sp.]|uniref:ABC transporter ATP-binding protein n=1 Tax=Ferrovibrio sp. TaxID=1917215 RepID=UPI00260C3341|nr:ABC transporter ATP-binding protein [Ferrovibrio sp.]